MIYTLNFGSSPIRWQYIYKLMTVYKTKKKLTVIWLLALVMGAARSPDEFSFQPTCNSTNIMLAIVKLIDKICYCLISQRLVNHQLFCV